MYRHSLKRFLTYIDKVPQPQKSSASFHYLLFFHSTSGDDCSSSIYANAEHEGMHFYLKPDVTSCPSLMHGPSCSGSNAQELDLNLLLCSFFLPALPGCKEKPLEGTKRMPRRRAYILPCAKGQSPFRRLICVRNTLMYSSFAWSFLQKPPLPNAPSILNFG